MRKGANIFLQNAGVSNLAASVSVPLFALRLQYELPETS